jgi:hypothetical protein
VVQNLFFDISGKNRKPVQKPDHISRRSTGEKMIPYLWEDVSRHNSAQFPMPFNRQQLANLPL